MRLHDLKPAAGARKDRKRLGRGNASGQGTTAGKGTKGEKARAGGLKAGFRGMSSRNFRLAKRRGFTNRFKIEFQPVNLSRLSDVPSGTTIDVVWLKGQGLVRGHNPQVKILGDGDIQVPITVVGVKTSGVARQKIEAVGGAVIDTIEEAPASATVPEAQVPPEPAPAAPRARKPRSVGAAPAAVDSASKEVARAESSPASEPTVPAEIEGTVDTQSAEPAETPEETVEDSGDTGSI